MLTSPPASGQGSTDGREALGPSFEAKGQRTQSRPRPSHDEIPLALGAHWAEVTPFVLDSAEQFRIPPPPALDSAEYAEAFDEVQRLGGDGDVTPTERTEEQGFIGVF
jgi:hypothetical protein